MDNDTLSDKFHDYFDLIKNTFWNKTLFYCLSSYTIKMNVFRFKLYLTAIVCFICQFMAPLYCIIDFYVNIESFLFFRNIDKMVLYLFLFAYITIFFVYLHTRLIYTYTQYILYANKINNKFLFLLGYVINKMSCLMPFTAIFFVDYNSIFIFIMQLLSGLFLAELDDNCVCDIINYYNYKQSNIISYNLSFINSIKTLFNFSYVLFVIEIIYCFANVTLCMYK